MKSVDLIRAIKEEGCVLVRHGGCHDWYKNTITGHMEAVPRHREISEMLARSIIRKLSSNS